MFGLVGSQISTSSCFLPKEFGFSWVEWEILKKLCFNNGERERKHKDVK
jgi:hypothetical protein